MSDTIINHSRASGYEPEFRSTAEDLADSGDCGKYYGCSRSLICQRCNYCLRHCCCRFWSLMTEWSAETSADFVDQIHDELLDMLWADDGGAAEAGV